MDNTSRSNLTILWVSMPLIMFFNFVNVQAQTREEMLASILFFEDNSPYFFFEGISMKGDSISFESGNPNFEGVLDFVNIMKLNPAKRCKVIYFSGNTENWPHDVTYLEVEETINFVKVVNKAYGVDMSRFWIISKFSSESGFWVVNFPISMFEIREKGIPGIMIFMDSN